MKIAAVAFAVLAAAVADGPLPDLAIRNARIVHGDGRITARGTVVVSAGRIARVVAGTASVRARRNIDAAGRTLIPGLIDAHVHVRTWMAPLFLRAGVTTVRDLHNDRAYILGLAEANRPDVPRIVAAGSAIDGTGTTLTGAIVVDTVSDARTAVREAAGANAAVISTGTRVNQALLSVIAAEGAARGIPVAAHLGQTNAAEAAEAGISSLEGLAGIADAASMDPERLRHLYDDGLSGWTASVREWRRLDPERLQEVARRLIEHDVVLVPALVQHEAASRLDHPAWLAGRRLTAVPRELLDREWNPGAVMAAAGWTPAVLADFRAALPLVQRFVVDYVRAGGRVAAGTGTPEPFVVPGQSLHRELQLYVAGGLTPAAALRAATIDAARLLGLADRVGTITAGKDADLVLLDGDPLRDIRALDRVALVVRRGLVVYP